MLVIVWVLLVALMCVLLVIAIIIALIVAILLLATIALHASVSIISSGSNNISQILGLRNKMEWPRRIEILGLRNL